ncbi:hypothetical protein EVAR_10468_1 [Eumeta japonica]|uniref:Uncharacterized protein n=1 Tax=Eumeta variegata TaxID=151549 RepID=A0A4C1THA6_EUMVA|nr:hypothetical protein EVAR_10468_1 [Eumeta japonica]
MHILPPRRKREKQKRLTLLVRVQQPTEGPRRRGEAVLIEEGEVSCVRKRRNGIKYERGGEKGRSGSVISAQYIFVANPERQSFVRCTRAWTKMSSGQKSIMDSPCTRTHGVRPTLTD